MSETRRVSFVDRVAEGDVVLLRFRDPASTYAVLRDGDGLEVTLHPIAASGQMATAETTRLIAEWTQGGAAQAQVKYRGVEAMWREGSALVLGEPAQFDSLLAGLAEFAQFEEELRKIEDEIGGAWAELDEDRGLAFEVKIADLKRSRLVGERMSKVFARRIRFARIERALWAPSATLATTAQKLGEELREAADIEARIETVDAQMEVFEHVYEMASQRMGEAKAAHETAIVEWIIIALLLGEAMLMAAQLIWRHSGQ